MLICENCGKKINDGDILWECNKVEVQDIDDDDNYEVGNIESSVCICDECMDLRK